MEDYKPPSKAQLVEVNSHLTCYLCKGYYIDATTIVECLHSFCRSCIILFLQANSYCPVCEMMINTAKPNIKPDKTLQDIVYKLVPSLYASEMCRRRRFWANHPVEAQKVSCPEARGHTTERIIFSPQDAISLSIEYTSDDQPDWNRNKALGGSDPDQEIPLRRYLQCPAMLRVEHLKKFICTKYNVDSVLFHVDILHKRVPLPDHYTLMDIAYIYSWKRNEPMKFFFRITEMHLVTERFDYLEPSSTNRVDSPQHTPARGQKSKHNTDKKETSAKVVQLAATTTRKPEDNNTCDKSKSSELKSPRDEINKSMLKRAAIAKKCEKNVSDNKIGKKVENKNSDVGNSVNDSEQKSHLNGNDNQNKHSELKIKYSDNCKEKREDTKKSPVSKERIDCEAKSLKEITKKDNTSKSDSNSVKNEITSSKIKTDTAVVNITRTPKKLATSTVNSNNSSSKIVHKTETLKTNNENVKKTKQHAQKASKISLEKDTETKALEKQNVIETTAKKSDISPKLTKKSPPKLETVSSLQQEVLDLEAKKSHFFNSIQLTAKTSLPLAPKRQSSKISASFTAALKQKIARKLQKNSDSDSSEPPHKIMKTLSQSYPETSHHDSDFKAKDIKDPGVTNTVSNVNRQVSNVTQIADQADSSKNSNANQPNQNERLQSLIDSCKLNIPSSLSITLTESPRNEDGSIVEQKHGIIKPVQNYIEILKLPDLHLKNKFQTTEDKMPLIEKNDDGKSVDQNKQNLTTQQKQTFQAMFEEAVRRKQSVKLHLYRIQVQALQAELEKKTSKCNSNLVKKQHNYALDLSRKTPETPDSTNSNTNRLIKNNSNLSTSPVPNTNANNSSNPNKRNILEIAHQLSKRSKLETALTSPTIRQSQTSPLVKQPDTTPSIPAKQVIINNNFSSGGSMSILDNSKINVNTTPKIPLSTPKLPIPRLPVTRVHKGRGGLQKSSNFLKLGTFSNKFSTNNNTTSRKSPADSNLLQNKVESSGPLLEKYNITNLAQFTSSFNQTQLAYQQALMVGQQLEMQRLQQNSDELWLSNANFRAYYENYLQTLKNQQNQKCSNANQN